MEVPFRGEIEAIPGGEFIVKALQRLFEELQPSPFRIGGSYIYTGQGSPEGVVVANVGDLYLRTDVIATSVSVLAPGAQLYVKIDGTATNTNWRQVLMSPLPTAGNVNERGGGIPINRIFVSDGTNIVTSFSTLTYDVGSGLVADLIQGTTGSFTTLSVGSGGLSNAGLTDLSGAAAGQVKFPASQNASSNANTLDDYEEGTWTPTIAGTGGQSGQVYTTQGGSYIKIGQFVYARCYILLSTLGTVTGNAMIGGLPFPVENNADGGSGGMSVGFFNGMTTAVTWLGGYVKSNTSNVQLQMLTAAATGSSNVVQADLSNTFNLQCSFVYRTTA